MAKKRSAIKEDEDDQASIHDESPQKRPRRDNDNPPSPIRKINPPGKPPEAGYKIIPLATLKEEAIGKDVQFIDVRTAIEYKNGHIDDALNMNILNKKKFKEQTELLDMSKPVYVYCMSDVGLQ